MRLSTLILASAVVLNFVPAAQARKFTPDPGTFMFIHAKAPVRAPAQTTDETPLESIVTAPERDQITAEDYVNMDNGTESSGPSDSYAYTTWDDPLKVVSFNFKNSGGNSILKQVSDADGFPHRTYDFEFLGRATQDIHFEIIDVVERADSHNKQANIYIFPRKIVPAISWPETGTTFSVTLPTGEVEVFDKETKTMISGPFSETKVDTNPDRFKRTYPQVSYTPADPKSVYFKQDSRTGADLREATTKIIQGKKSCTVATKLLFDTAVSGGNSSDGNPHGDVSFKFASDLDFNKFLKTNPKCKMDFLN